MVKHVRTGVSYIVFHYISIAYMGVHFCINMVATTHLS